MPDGMPLHQPSDSHLLHGQTPYEESYLHLARKSGDILKRLHEESDTNPLCKTDLSTLETQLRTLDFVISADSGGLHFANFLGLPTVALFGFTNPSYSKPFFDAPTLVLQSPTNRMEDLASEVVFEKVQGWLEGLTVSK